MNSTTQNYKFNPTRPARKSGWTPLGVAALVLGFMVKWYIGLAVLGYMMWGGRIDDLAEDAINAFRKFTSPAPASSGNAAFDAYKAQVLKDLEEEQKNFDEFVNHLRQARDRDEFERFMKSRKK